MSRKILITGGCGFAGSNLAIQLKTNHPDNKVIVFDNLKRRGSELNIFRLKEHGIIFIHGDIRNKEDFEPIGPIDTMIEAAAEPSVLSGLDSTPEYVINSNLTGTLNCLNFALKHNAEVIFLSTSRVYPIDKICGINYHESDTRFIISEEQSLPGISATGISEAFSLEGARSFYGTSKLASEMFIQEYAAFYGLKAIINRCGVLAGPWQMGKVDQGVVVLWMARHFWKRELNYIGFGGGGKQVRDVLHIDDLYRLIELQLADFSKFRSGVFNVGGGTGISVSLKELTGICEEITGNRITIHSVKETRTADIPVYITDNSKIQALCGWRPELSPKQILTHIFEWIRSNESAVKNILN